MRADEAPTPLAVVRPHLILHSLLLLVVAGISYWGEGAAFLVLYSAALALTLVLIAIVHGVAFLRERLARERRQPPSEAASTDALSLPWRLTRWILRGLAFVLCASVSTALVVGFVARRSEPIGSFPGGALSGEVASAPVEDWSFLDEFEMVQLQVSPGAPRSINLHSFVLDGALYVGADFYFPFKRWVHEAMRDDRVILRARGVLHPMRATRILDPSEAAALQRELEHRLALWRGLDPETTPGFQTEVWLFRLDSR